MPNWCSNEITITGDKDKIKSVLTKIREIPENDNAVLFKTLIGEDPDLKKVGWYESNLKRYGTKWDVSVGDCNGEFDEEQIKLYPDTAWSPPVPFCITLAKEYGVYVKIVFYEPGCDFAGMSFINPNGEIEMEEDYEYDQGRYVLDNDGFWGDRENDYLDDVEDMTTHIEERFPFLDESDVTKLKEIYDNIINNRSEDSGE
jgi:hypothetical protein